MNVVGGRIVRKIVVGNESALVGEVIAKNGDPIAITITPKAICAHPHRNLDGFADIHEFLANQEWYEAIMQTDAEILAISVDGRINFTHSGRLILDQGVLYQLAALISCDQYSADRRRGENNGL